MAKAAPQPEYSFPLKHPALVATVVTIAIAAAFLGALYINATGHPAAPHGAAPVTSNSAHAADGMPQKGGAPAPTTSAKR